MLAIADERAGKVLAGEHPSAGYMRHRPRACGAPLPGLREVLREPDAHGQSITTT